MHALFIVGLVFAAVTALTMPYYCKITFRDKNRRTLTVKMILCTLFLITAFLSLFSHSPRHGHVFVMLLGFLFDYVGDYILGKDGGSKAFVAGSCCFAVGHVLYAVAFSMAQKKLFPQVGWFNGLEIGIFIAVAYSEKHSSPAKTQPNHFCSLLGQKITSTTFSTHGSWKRASASTPSISASSTASESSLTCYPSISLALRQTNSGAWA